MPKTISKALEQRLLRAPDFLKTLQDLHAISGVEALYVGGLGGEKLRAPREGGTALRRLDHQIPSLVHTRQESRQAQLAGAPPDASLPWREVIHPLRIDQEIIGYIVLSAWRPAAGSLESVRDLWRGWAGSGIDVRWSDLESAWRSLPEATNTQLEAWTRHVRLIADETLRRLETPHGTELHPDQLPPLIKEACEQVQENFKQAMTLTETARTCGVSPEHLSRTFHHTTGLRFGDYVTETRIQEVCNDLRATSDPIGLIAERNGFPTLSRFNKAFRETTGMTPREWRKRQFLNRV